MSVDPLNDATHAYVGRGKCGHVILLQVDMRDRDTAKSVAEVIREGGTVDRVTVDAARTMASQFCTCHRKKPAAQTELGL